MKKILIMAFVAVLLTACGKDTPQSTDSNIGNLVSDVINDVIDNAINEITEDTFDEPDDLEVSEPPPADELPDIGKEVFVTVTTGKILSDNQNTRSDLIEIAAGETIEAFPLDLNTVFDRPYSYSNKYYWEMVSFSGYVHNLNLRGGGTYGSLTLSAIPMRENEEIEKYWNTVHCESPNISADFGWDIADGDYITVVGWFKGLYTPKGNSYFVLNDLLMVE